MENFGYLEIAIAQENCYRSQQQAAWKQPQSHASVRQQPRHQHASSSSDRVRRELEDTQVVGWLGLF